MEMTDSGYRDQKGMEDRAPYKNVLVVFEREDPWPKIDPSPEAIHALVKRNSNCISKRIEGHYHQEQHKNCVKRIKDHIS